ncbi:MAG TPA: hypothetical protein V6D29_05660 [Leptolyngbyaceae cyanobacterium]
MQPVDLPSGKDILEAVRRRAIEQWGEDKWKANLVREYVKIVKARGLTDKDQNATAVNRRPQIDRAFEQGSCTLDTAIALAAAVGCRFQMACTEVRIEEF